MSNGGGQPPGSAAWTIYCTQCGQAMRVAPQHARTLVTCPHCQQTLEPWRVAATMAPEAMPPPPPPPGYSNLPRDWRGYSWRNRWVAGLLGVFLGPFGVHRMYLGFVGIGILQAVLTVGSFFVLTPVIAIWALIEGVLCFCGAMRDVDGLPLRG